MALQAAIYASVYNVGEIKMSCVSRQRCVVCLLSPHFNTDSLFLPFHQTPELQAELRTIAIDRNLSSYSYAQWVYDMCLETTHLGTSEMQLLYDVTQVTDRRHTASQVRHSAPKFSLSLFNFFLHSQVPFLIVSHRDENRLGFQLRGVNDEGDRAWTYLIGQAPRVGDPPVNVVIGFNGTDHFSPTMTTGNLSSWLSCQYFALSLQSFSILTHFWSLCRRAGFL